MYLSDFCVTYREENLTGNDERAMAGVYIHVLALSLTLSPTAPSQTIQECTGGVNGQ